LSTHEFKVQGVREINRQMKMQMDTSHIRTKENEARLVSLNVIPRDSTLFSTFGIETPKRDKRVDDASAHKSSLRAQEEV
jgi:hypothetical protein